MAKEAADKAAAEQAIKDEEARQKAEVEAKFQEYSMREAAIQAEIKNLPMETYQSGVEIRKDKIGKAVYNYGSSKGRLVFEHQTFPIYDTRYTPESETKLKDLQTELTTLQQQHQASLSDPYYKQLSEQQSTQTNRAAAEAKLEQLKKQKAYIESFPTPTPQGAHVSNTQRRQVAEATAKRSHEISQLESQIKQTEAYLQSPGVAGLSLKTEQFEGIKYSSPSGAIGYNPMTGRVEVGTGNIRGTVVSQSAAEDKMELERIKKEAGYTGKATIDPRIGVFKTVDDGIMTPGFKAQPHVDILRQFDRPIVTPQRDRKSILTDQPDSKYANPDFVSREKQALLDDAKQGEPAKNYFISLDESPQLYTLEFESGTKLEGLTSAQVAEYQKTFELGAKLYEFKKEKAREQTLTSLADIRKFVREAKTAGYTTISINTDQGPKDIPINKDTTRILAKGEYQGAKIQGAGVVPNIPAGFTLAGQIGSPVFVGNVTPLPVDTKGILERDPSGLSRFTQEATQYDKSVVGPYGPRRPDDPLAILATTANQYYATLGTGAAGMLNLVKSGFIYGAELAGDKKLAFAATIGVPTQYQAPPTGFDVGFSAPITAGIESYEQGNVTAFIPTITQELQKSRQLLTDTEIAAVAGQGAGFWVLSGAPVPTKVLKVVPLRYGSLPVYTRQGEVIAQRTLAFGYDTKNFPIVTKYGVYGAGKFKLGKIDYEKTGVREFEGVPGSSFDRFQPTNYNPFQQSMFKRIQKYAEDQGITPKGFVEGVEKTAIQQRDVMPSIGFEYEKQVPGYVMPAVPGYKGGAVVEAAGKSPLDKLYEAGGVVDESVVLYHGTTKKGAEKILSGKIQENLYATPTYKEAAEYGDVVLAIKLKPGAKFVASEFVEEGTVRLGKVERLGGSIREAEISSPKLIEKVTVAKTKKQYLTEAKPTFDIFAGVGKVIRKKYTDATKGSVIYKMLRGGLSREVGDIDIEAKSLEKGEKAVASLLKTDVPEGYALEREGFNIAIGEADPEKAFFNIKLAKGELAHGTDLESALQIQKYGADPSQRPYGMPAFFATEDASIFANFASGSKNPRVVVGRIENQAELLEYKNIPKRERKRIIDTSFEMEKRYGIPQWAGYQELLAEYATKRGYKAVTKPYKGLTPDAPKFETIVLEKGVFKAERIVEPSRYGIKEGTGEKIINIVTEKEEIKNIGNLDTSKVYGKSYPNKKIKYEIPGDKEKFASLTMEYQYQAKLASIGGVESRASLKGEGLSDEAIDQIMGDYQFVRGGKGRRFIKDVMDKYLGEREAARVQFQKGDRAGALKSAAAMRATQEYYGKMFDFGKAFREYRLEVDTTPPIKGESLLEKSSGSVARGAARASPRTIPPTGEREQEKRTVSARVSSASVSPRISVRVSPSVSTSISSSMSASISVRTSPAQLSVYGSAKSASVRSSASPSSARSASAKPSSAKSPSIRSPSPKSFFSPKTRSPLSPSPKSGSAPSPKMTSSPSPGITSGPSPLVTSPPSPRVTSPPSPIIRPDLDILIPKPPPKVAIPFVKQKTDKEREKAEKERADFIGQAKVSEIVGFGRRGDITYGRVLTAKLAGRDVRESGKRSGSFVRSRSVSLLERTKPNLIKKDKKAKEFRL